MDLTEEKLWHSNFVPRMITEWFLAGKLSWIIFISDCSPWADHALCLDRIEVLVLWQYRGSKLFLISNIGGNTLLCRFFSPILKINHMRFPDFSIFFFKQIFHRKTTFSTLLSKKGFLYTDHRSFCVLCRI